MLGLSALLATLLPAMTPSELPLVVGSPKNSVRISPHLFGVFFEEINHAGDGGLYPELLNNRSFHVSNGVVGDWEKGPGVQWNTFDPNKAVASIPAGSYVENRGYWGVSLKKGLKYKVVLDGLGPTVGDVSQTASITVAIFSGKELAFVKKATFKGISGPSTNPWSKVSFEFTAPQTIFNGQVVFKAGKSPVQLAYASLMPIKTFGKSGLRPDLAGAVASIKPGFVRFPGGCYVEGGDFLKDRFNWKKTLSSDDERPGHLNANWGYWSTDGLGFHEYLQWCADMHSEPLFVFNCGLSHKEQVPLNKLQGYLQDALDAIEYANGPVTSKWGALRAKRGHPEPFGLRYVEIGNENGMFGGFGGSRKQYEERYLPIYKAIKAKYPYIRTVADTRVSAPMDIVDDHYYNSPAWFWQNVGLYDRAPRKGPKIYVGEYAVTSDCGQGNLKAGLAEAAFMTGLERNGDVVEMASYAPLFVNTNNRAWNPDAIVFNGSEWYGTPSYWVQKLFADNRVDRIVPISVPQVTSPPTPGWVGVGSWSTQVEYKDLTVVLPGDRHLVQDQFKPYSGSWKFGGTGLQQKGQDQPALALAKAPKELEEALAVVKSENEHRKENLASNASALNYTVHVKARKLSGDEGFLVLVRAQDDHNFLWFNIGGWGNTSVAAEKESAGGRAVISRQKPFHVETGRWYDIQIDCRAEDISLLIDGVLVQQVKDRSVPRIAADAGIDSQHQQLVVKIVNGDSQDRRFDLRLPFPIANRLVSVQTLRARQDPGSANSLMTLENSFGDPHRIAIYGSKAKVEKGLLKLSSQRGSVSVVRIPLR